MVLYRLDLPSGELQYLLGAAMIEFTHGTVAVVIASKKVPNAVEVKANKFVSFRFVTVVNYAYLSSKKDFESVKTSLVYKCEMVRRELIRSIVDCLKSFL